jgi:exosortase/archaeosortase family protein
MSSFAAVQSALDRSTLYFWLFLIAAGNKLADMMIISVRSGGWFSSLVNLFGISVILWIALVAGLVLLRRAPSGPIRQVDIGVAALVFGAAIVPISGLSAAALTVAAAYAMTTSSAGSVLRRSAIIFLAMTSSLLWGPFVLGLFNGPILGVDAYLVSHLASASQTGNQITFIGRPAGFAITPACSSFHGMSLELVFWATVNQWFKVRFEWTSLVWVAAAIAATVAVNIARLAAIARFPDDFQALHTGWGGQVAAWSALFLVVGICLYGARRDVFARA